MGSKFNVCIVHSFLSCSVVVLRVWHSCVLSSVPLGCICSSLNLLPLVLLEALTGILESALWQADTGVRPSGTSPMMFTLLFKPLPLCVSRMFVYLLITPRRWWRWQEVTAVVMTQKTSLCYQTQLGIRLWAEPPENSALSTIMLTALKRTKILAQDLRDDKVML